MLSMCSGAGIVKVRALPSKRALNLDVMQLSFHLQGINKRIWMPHTYRGRPLRQCVEKVQRARSNSTSTLQNKGAQVHSI